MPTVKPDRQLVARYTANAAKDILLMLEAGVVKVGDRNVHIKNFKHARTVKLGKLARHLGYIVNGAPDPRALEHRRNVATWQAVGRTLERATTQRAVKQLAAARSSVATRARTEAR